MHFPLLDYIVVLHLPNLKFVFMNLPFKIINCHAIKKKRGGRKETGSVVKGIDLK